MKTKFISTLLLFSSLFLSGCYNSRDSIGRYNLPVSDIKNPTKEGRSCGTAIFPFYSFYTDFDLSVERARKEAGITNIVSIEMVKNNAGFLYIKKCVVVKGN